MFTHCLSFNNWFGTLHSVGCSYEPQLDHDDSDHVIQNSTHRPVSCSGRAGRAGGTAFEAERRRQRSCVGLAFRHLSCMLIGYRRQRLSVADIPLVAQLY